MLWHWTWQKRNFANLDEGHVEIYRYNELMDKTSQNFYAADSVGKYIGMVPYRTAEENLAYLGADMSICALPSSTYNG